MDLNTIALLVTGALGMVGWFFAWWGQRSVVDKNKEVAAAVAGENAAKTLVLAAETKATAALAQLLVAQERAQSLNQQLDAERKARQDLVRELAKNGVPVGGVVVDAAFDRLYQDGGGQGSGSGDRSGGDPKPLSGQPAEPSGSSSGR
jgi:hypothetical protein